MSKILGVIGGMGPAATASFIDDVVKLTQAETDQEHIQMFVAHATNVPDRTGYILGKSTENPGPVMAEAGKKLENAGCCAICITCMTAHCFYKYIQDAVNIPVINALEEIAAFLKKHGYKKAGLMATDGTFNAGVFPGTLEKNGIEVVRPGEEGQKKVMHVIYDNVKAGKEVEMDLFNDAANELREKGAEIIILGCTELSVINSKYDIGAGFLDSLEVLSYAAINKCGGTVRPEWEAKYIR